MTNEDLTKDIADDVASKSEDIAGTLGHRQRRASTAKGIDSEGRGQRRAWTWLEIEVGEHRCFKGVDETGDRGRRTSVVI